ncbi:MAG: metal ABC transporter permease [Caldilinea sp.]|nr:metal ABC transporter permease [Caldilineaceae bacterium]MCB9119635.1 metal ABC transporter permease [Caldilineaceae bacterium]MCB9124313.1 metal ABC transporter permease [Caldilineaceae bacterium]MCO5210937.1 metal ABC transporter permease [Caldilinea sp.]HRW50335.1 metal ABC transporter permease [Caldilinea sp.]
MDILHLLTDPLAYGFMVRALLAAIMVGIICPVVGTYMVLKGLSFFGDALAHSILPGVVLTFLFGWPLALGAMISALVAAFLIGVISQRSTLQEDTAIGIVFAGAFALGVAMISTASNYAVDLTHILFGDVLGVSTTDLWVMLVLGLVVLGAIVAFYKEFLVLTFDPVLALVLRLPATALRYLLLGVIALTVVTSLQTVGIALVLAMLVTPAATAQLLTRRLPPMMMVAALLGVFANVTGLYISYYLNIASGPTMVLVSTLIFGLVFLFAPGRGIIWRMTSNGGRSPAGASPTSR